MPILWVKLQLDVAEIPYTNSTGISSSINFRYVQQSIDGVSIQVSPDLSPGTSVQTGPTTTTAGPVTTSTFGPVSPSNFKYTIEQKEINFPYLNSNFLFAGELDNIGNNLYVTLSGIAVDAFFVGDPGRSLSETSNIGLPTQTFTITALGPRQFTYTLPKYEWVSLNLSSSPLFTINDDVVDFNNLKVPQIQALPFSDIYHTQSGNDTVVLPSASSAANLGGSGTSFSLTTQFVMGNGNDTITGSDAAYNVAIGSGADTITLGNGNNSLVGAGLGADVVTVGNGTNTIILGDGNDVVVVGNGTDNVTVGNGNDFLYGGTGTDNLKAGSGTDVLVSFSGSTTLSGGSGNNTFQVRSGDKITGFHGGDLIEVVIVSPTNDIDNAVISNLDGQTKINTYDISGKETLSVVMDGTFNPTLFSASNVFGNENYLELTYGPPNLTNIFQGIATVIYNVGSVILKAEQDALTFVQNYVVKDISTQLASYAVRGIFKSPVGFVATNLISLSYDFGVATTQLVKGDINGSQYATVIAKSLASWIPLGSSAAAVGSALVSHMIDDYYASLDAQLYNIPANAATVPITIVPPLSGGPTTGNTIFLNDSSKVNSIPSSDMNDTLISSVNVKAPAGVTEVIGYGSNSLILSGTGDGVVIADLGGNGVLSGGGNYETFILSSGTNEITDFNSSDTIDIQNPDARIVSSNIIGDPYTSIVIDVDGTGQNNLTVNLDNTAITGFSSAITSADLLISVACFRKGTAILTDSGERPVEALATGDTVVTGSGVRRRIRWIGHRSYAGRFLAANPNVQPIRFLAGSLGDGLPRRDLFVSPEHAMFLDGVLIPAKLLVNGETVVQEADLPIVEYFHVELDSHDVLLAEGALSESFVDCDSRGMFQNAHTFTGSAPRWSFCAPRVEEGPVLARIRDRLRPCRPAQALSAIRGHLDRATHEGCAGWACLPEDPNATLEVEVLVDGAVIARVTANSWRPDVKAHGIGTGRYGFELTFAQPLSRFRMGTVTARAVGGGDLIGAVQLDAATELDLACLPGLAAALQARATTVERASEITGFLLDQLRAVRSVPHRRETAPLALVLDHAMPRLGQDAGSAAVLSHMQSLRRLGYQVVFVPLDGQPGQLPDGIGCAAWPEFPTVEGALRQHGDVTVVYVHRVEGMSLYGPLIRRACPGARLLYSVADLHFLRLGRQAEVERSASRMAESCRLRDQELAAVRLADMTLTHSGAEAEVLRRLIPGASVGIVPWHVPCAPAPYVWRRRSGLVFVGGMAHAPNADALRWLASDVMPRIVALNPRIRCKVAGEGLTDADRAWLHPAMEVLGPVEDLARVYRSARLAVAPLRFGAGVKGKVLEAFAAGLPCAMTPIAAEGLDLPEPLHLLVAEDADAFAALVVELHANSAFNQTAGNASRAFVASATSQEVVDDALANAAASARAHRFPLRSRAAG